MKKCILCILSLFLVSVCLSAQAQYSQTETPTPAGAVFLGAMDMNDSGDVIGMYYLEWGYRAPGIPFLYRKGVLTTLPISFGDPEGQVYVSHINNPGGIIGTAALPDGQYHGFLYSRNTVFDLGTFFPSAINNRGDIVGGGLHWNRTLA